METPRGALYFCAAPNLAAAAAAPRFAQGLDGIEHAELVVSVEGAYHTEKLVEACRVARRRQARPPGAPA